MYTIAKDLLSKPVKVRTLCESLPRPSEGPVVVFEIAEGCLVLEKDPGELIVIPWSSVVSIEIDYQAARSDGWHELPDEPGALPDIRRKLFEAERGRLVGLREEKIDELALSAHGSLRWLRLSFPDSKFITKLRERSAAALVGSPDPNTEEEVKGGEVDSMNYRRARDLAAKIKAALAARKSEDKVGLLILGLALHSGNALAKYPNHAELRAWFNEAEALRQKLEPKTLRDYDMESPFVAGDAASNTGLYAEG